MKHPVLWQIVAVLAMIGAIISVLHAKAPDGSQVAPIINGWALVCLVAMITAEYLAAHMARLETRKPVTALWVCMTAVILLALGVLQTIAILIMAFVSVITIPALGLVALILLIRFTRQLQHKSSLR